MVRINIQDCTVQIPTKRLGWTRDRFTKARLRNWLARQTQQVRWNAQAPVSNSNNPQDWVDDFSEKITQSAVQNISRYFTLLGQSGYTLGGRRASSRPLLYERRQLQPSNEDIGALGEGVAGFYLEFVVGLTFEVRPFGVDPDFIFIDAVSGRAHLVQVKSHLHTSRLGLTDALRLLEVLAKSKLLRKQLYFGDLVCVGIHGPSQYELKHLELQEV